MTTHRHGDDQQPGGENRIHIREWAPGDVAMFRNLADEAAKKAVEQFAVSMGLDPNQPIVSQALFQELRGLAKRSEERTANDAWVSRWRPRTEGLPGKVAVVALGIAVLGALNTFWTGFKSVITTASLPHP